MTVRKSYKPGEFCWTDIGTTDVKAAKKFYKAVFGCTITDMKMGPGADTYSILRVKGKDVGGLYPITAADKKKKVKPSWLPYISIKNLARSMAKAKAAGAKVVDAPKEVGDAGRFAVLKDPAGAEFALWQPGTNPGADLEDAPGSVTWHDLSVKNTKAAGKFYTTTLGWKVRERKFSEGAYYIFMLGKIQACGMWPSPMSGLPPCWITHWKVADCAKAAATVKRLKGKVLMGPMAVPGMGRFAIAADPQGAAFGIIGK